MLFALVASLLSVVAAILEHVINVGEDSSTAIHYDLCLVSDRPKVPGSSTISEEEKKRITTFGGWRQKLSESLTAMWRIEAGDVMVGNTMMTENGADIHFVHVMRDNTVLRYQSDDSDGEVTTLMIARKLYGDRQSEINSIFRRHFKVGTSFRVQFRARSSADAVAPESVEMAKPSGLRSLITMTAGKQRYTSVVDADGDADASGDGVVEAVP